MSFSDFDLNNAEVGGELNPLAYNPDDYPTIEEVLGGVLMGRDEPVYISPEELSVNGLVVADKMSDYLVNESESSSALKEVIKNPAAYYFYKNDKSNLEEPNKKCFELGTFCHSAFLEPELFSSVAEEPNYSMASTDGVNNLIAHWQDYLIKNGNPDDLTLAGQRFSLLNSDMSKLDGKKKYLECLKEVANVTVISSNHKAIIDLIKRNYYRYGGGIIPMLLKGAQIEHSFYGVDQDTGLKVKVRPDAFNVAENIGVNAVISLKTTSAADMGKFVYDSAKYKYELSEGYYQNVMSEVTGRQFNVTIMIVLQTVAPFLPAVFIWDPEDLTNGKYKARYALDTIKECKESGLYPGFESLAEQGHCGIIQMKQPEWAAKTLQPVDLEN